MNVTKQNVKQLKSQWSKIEHFQFSMLIYRAHPWAGEDLSLKIDERDQTIWICILEL